MIDVNITNLFDSPSSSNRIIQSRGPFAGTPALFGQDEKEQTTLQKLSSQIIAGQDSSEQLEDLSEIAQIKKDSYIPKNSSNKNPLDDISDDVLKSYMGILNMYSAGSTRYRYELSDFKEQLQRMDDTIQSYQDILDGKAPLGEGQNMLDVSLSCALAKVHRQQFFEHGMTHFNKDQFEIPNPDAHNHDDVYEKLINTLLGDCRFSLKDERDWGIDPYASDIYSEIDRVLTNLDGRIAETKRGIGRLYGLLYERGYGEKYKGCLDEPADPEPSHIAQSIASWKRGMEQLRQTDLQEVVEAPLQAPVWKL